MADPARYLSFLNDEARSSNSRYPSHSVNDRSHGTLTSRYFRPGSKQPASEPLHRTENDDSFQQLLQQHQSEVPLDAFDKELLAERPDERQWQASQGLQRISLPPRVSTPAFSRPPHIQVLPPNSRYKTPSIGQSSSPSPTISLSSPTVQALSQKRNQRQQGTVPPLASRRENPSSTNCEKDHLSASEPPAEMAAGRAMQLGHAPPIVQGIRLVSAHDLPDRFRSIFPYPVFSSVQSKCFGPVFHGDDNLVLSAPTGSGKTVVMELAICRSLQTSKNGQFKVVYQAPTKSLCSERYRDWHRKFGPLDLQCAELTGDTDQMQLKSVQSASIIITTPEKWDSVTRKWKDHLRLVQMVKLVLIDEVHILKEARGATLEAVVSRMKSVGTSIRFVALSATVPNAEDVAVWLGKNSMNHHLPAHLEKFGESFRPVQLQKFVYGVPPKGNDFVLDKILNDKLPEYIAKHSNKKPILIFCCTRSSCVSTANSLASLWNSTNPPRRLWPGPTRIPAVQSPELRKSLIAGVSFHHAGLDLSDRKAVEQGFLDGQISIICCTSTLAVGVNLPCYLVVIKNTVTYTDSGLQEYADLEMMQMLGRAGRPQFEQSACAVIITKEARVAYYQKMVSGQQCLESCLHLNLIDHLNAEIGLGTVSDVASARKWLGSTFLFVRLRSNPGYYRLKEGISTSNSNDIVDEICAKDFTLLQETELITHGERIKCTEFGEAMARYYIKFETMRILMSLPPKARMSEMLSAIAQAAEFKDIRLKAGEKSLFKDINKDVGIRFPIKVDLALPAHKVSLLIQSELGGVDFPTSEQHQKHKHAFSTDRALVLQHVNRLIRCIIDCQLQLEDSVAVRNALELARSFGAKAWDNSPLQLKQLEQIGNVAVRKLAAASVNSIETLEATEAHRIEHILGKNPPFGMKLLARASEFPKLRVAVKMMGKESKPGKAVCVKLKAEIGFMNDKVPQFFARKQVFVCFLAETSDGKLIDFRRMSARKVQNQYEMLLTANLTGPLQFVNCYVMCDEIAGTLRHAMLKPSLSAALFPVPARQNQTSAPKARQRSNVSIESGSTKSSKKDEFGDGGLNDQDLLDAVDDGRFLDLDEFPDTGPEMRGSQLNMEKHADKLPKPKPAMVPDEDWEPTQLDNGKYACKHFCKDKPKCSHQCCKHGLDRPPKRPMKPVEVTLPATAEVSSRTSKAKVAESPSPKLQTKLKLGSNLFEKADRAFQEKRHYNERPGAQERKKLTKLHASTTGTKSASSTISSSAPLNTFAGGGQPKLSFLKDSIEDQAEESWADEHGATNGDKDYDEFSLGDGGEYHGLFPEPKMSKGSATKDLEVTGEDIGLSHSDQDKVVSAPSTIDRTSSPTQAHNTSSSSSIFDTEFDFDILANDNLWPTASEDSSKVNVDPVKKDQSTVFSPAIGASSPLKLFPLPSSRRTEDSSPFKRLFRNEEHDAESPGPKRRKTRPEDLMLMDSDADDVEVPESLKQKKTTVPLPEITGVGNWERVEEARRRKEKEERDRKTWELVGKDFEEQFRDLVEFV